MKKAVLATFFVIIALTGCTQRVADLTVASTKNMNLNSDQFVVGNRVTGNDTKAVVLFPLGVPTVKEAADKAIEQDRCTVGLSDVVVEQGFFSFIFGAIWLDVEGNQIIDKGIKGCENWVLKPVPKIEKKEVKFVKHQ